MYKIKDRKGERCFFISIIKQCLVRVGILTLYMIRHLHLTFSENHAQMEIKGF